MPKSSRFGGGMVRCRVPAEVFQKIEAKAAREMTTPSQIMRDALMEYLEKEEVTPPLPPPPLQGKRPAPEQKREPQTGEEN